LGVELKLYPVRKKIVEKPPRNSAGFCGGGQGLSWAVEPRKGRRGDIVMKYTKGSTVICDQLPVVRGSRNQRNLRKNDSLHADICVSQRKI
jgi:hypothetical protein